MLRIETNNEILEGEVGSVDDKGLRLELEKVRDIRRNFTYNTPQTLFYNQMIDIQIIPKKGSDDTKVNSEKIGTGDSSKAKCERHPTKAQKSMKPNSNGAAVDSVLDTNRAGLKLLHTRLPDAIHISQDDQKYQNALVDINHQSMVGVLIVPRLAGGNRKATILVVATSKNVYIFDMPTNGNSFCDFASTMESEWPRKALHNGHKQLENLKQFKLGGVFDTFVAYCLTTGKKTPETFEEIAQEILNLPPTYFESEESPQRDQHHLTQEWRSAIAKKALLQLKLAEHLLHEHMLMQFYRQCDEYSHTFSNDDDAFEVEQLLATKKAGFERIKLNDDWKTKLDPTFYFKSK
uniref:3'-5' exonuclease domain-containing protein n=1 Tax=Glossina austeni TaxID=7395 RepID=A0A1A9V2F2_GLOAU